MLRSRNEFYDRFVVSYIITKISEKYKCDPVRKAVFCGFFNAQTCIDM